MRCRRRRQSVVGGGDGGGVVVVVGRMRARLTGVVWVAREIGGDHCRVPLLLEIHWRNSLRPIDGRENTIPTGSDNN